MSRFGLDWARKNARPSAQPLQSRTQEQDAEHAARTKLVRIAAERTDEDGYSISAEYMASLNHNERRRREGETNRLNADLFCGDLVRKYGKPSNMPIWVLMELLSFGSFTSLYLFCAERWDNKGMKREHYMLRQCQSIRNACAHSSAMLNGVASINTTVTVDAGIQRALAESGISHRSRTAKMKNPRIRQITTLMYLHKQLITSGSGRNRAILDLEKLQKQIRQTTELMPTNDAVVPSLNFLATLIDKWPK